MKTHATKASEIERDWFVVDARDQTLGRLASRIATILRGKHKPYFSPNLDTGDYVIVVNAGQVRVTGKKLDDKMYYRHSGYPSGLRSINLRDLLARRPTRVIRLAVWGMLPHNRLGRKMMKKLKVYEQATHPHTAQQPKPLEL